MLDLINVGLVSQLLILLKSGQDFMIDSSISVICRLPVDLRMSLDPPSMVLSLLEVYQSNLLLLGRILLDILDIILCCPADVLRLLFSDCVNHKDFEVDREGTKQICRFLYKVLQGNRTKIISEAILQSKIIPRLIGCISKDWNEYYAHYRKILYRYFVETHRYLVIDADILQSLRNYLESSFSDDEDLICLCVQSCCTHPKTNLYFVIMSYVIPGLMKKHSSPDALSALLEITQYSIRHKRVFTDYLIECGIIEYLLTSFKKYIGKFHKEEYLHKIETTLHMIIKYNSKYEELRSVISNLRIM